MGQEAAPNVPSSFWSYLFGCDTCWSARLKVENSGAEIAHQGIYYVFLPFSPLRVSVHVREILGFCFQFVALF